MFKWLKRFGWRKRLAIEHLAIEHERMKIEGARLRIELRQLELAEKSAAYMDKAQSGAGDAMAKFIPVLTALMAGRKDEAARLMEG